MGRRRYKAQDVIDALREAEGNLSHAARILGCARSTVYSYIDKYSTVAEAYAEESERAVDKVEHALMKAIEDGNVTAMIFFLKTKGKSRGYVEKQQLEHSGRVELEGAPERIVIDSK